MNIAVLFGGNNSERDVSIASASQVVKALRARNHQVTAIDTAHGILSESDEAAVFQQTVRATPPTLEELAKLHDETTLFRLVDILRPFDIVFFALHGTPAEDGQIQGLLEEAGIRHTGSSSVASARAWYKDVSKEIFVQHNLPTPRWIKTTNGDGLVETLGLPMVIKPIDQGSTVGITLVKTADELDAAIANAARYGEVLAEEFIKGREITVGVLAGKALGAGEIGIQPDGIFSYEAKYQAGAITETFPADLNEELYQESQALALTAHQALELGGYSRSDFRLDENGKFWLIEVNSLPGMTSGSLLPQSAAVEGISFEELCDRICQEAITN
jgi:D-alanine-D-alanine ligase